MKNFLKNILHLIRLCNSNNINIDVKYYTPTLLSYQDNLLVEDFFMTDFRNEHGIWKPFACVYIANFNKSKYYNDILKYLVAGNWSFSDMLSRMENSSPIFLNKLLNDSALINIITLEIGKQINEDFTTGFYTFKNPELEQILIESEFWKKVKDCASETL